MLWNVMQLSHVSSENASIHMDILKRFTTCFNDHNVFIYMEANVEMYIVQGVPKTIHKIII